MTNSIKVFPTKSDSDAGYCKMPDGTLIQYGYFENPLSGSSYTGAKAIALNEAFVNNYSVIANSQYKMYASGYTGLDIFCVTQAISNTSIAIYLRKTDGTIPQYPIIVHWIAIGRWK